MANPQKEDGYTPIANEILEQLARVSMPNSEFRVLMVLFRKTYGWNKKEDEISLSQFSSSSGLHRSHVCRALMGLIKKNIVTKVGNGYITKYKIQKDFDKWNSLPYRVKVLPTQDKTVTHSGNKVLPIQAHTKDIKDNIQKKEQSLESAEFDVIWNKYPSKTGVSSAKKSFQKTVKTKEDLTLITNCLDVYLKHLTANSWKKPQNGSTWFNNWRDWIGYKETSEVKNVRESKPFPTNA